MSTAPAILASGLVRLYDGHRAVDGVSLEVRGGEVLGLLGPNGAGKTTLLRMLAGVLAPTSGIAAIGGHDVGRAPAQAKAELGFLSGDTALYGRLTVRETLIYFGRLWALSPAQLAARVAAVSAALGLDDFLDLRVAVLSTGQRQRANLARAFLTDPPVLILDEPTTGLDVVSGRFVHDAVRRARAGGKAVLFSTHVMSEVTELCDRIAVLVHGRIRALGTEREILEAHEKRSLAEVIWALSEEPR